MAESTGEYWDGFAAALDLMGIELEKIFKEKYRIATDAILDAKNSLVDIRTMMPYEQELLAG